MERTILVVDDEKPILEILKFNLEKEGFKVLGAGDGEEGLILALTKNPDFCRFSVSDLANHLGYSRAHFTRKFAAESNISPGKFLLDWRLNMAAKILSSQYIQIKAVAYQTGFTDVSHFCRVFRRKYHLSPEEFRRSNSGKA